LPTGWLVGHVYVLATVAVVVIVFPPTLSNPGFVVKIDVAVVVTVTAGWTDVVVVVTASGTDVVVTVAELWFSIFSICKDTLSYANSDGFCA
jgi:hypothetical protein